MAMTERFCKMPCDILSRKDLTPADKCFYAAISNRQRQNGECWPSESRIAADTGLGRRTVQRSAAHCQTKGLVEIRRQTGKTNRYRLLSLTSAKMAQADPSQNGATLRQNGATTSAKMARHQRQNGAQIEERIDLKEKTHQKKKEMTAAEKEKVLELFVIFWTTYPKKVGKGAARKAWLKIAPSEELAAEMNVALGLQKKTKQWQRENGQYIPHPTTWLNQQRWEDEVQVRKTAEELIAEYDANTAARKAEAAARKAVEHGPN